MRFGNTKKVAEVLDWASENQAPVQFVWTKRMLAVNHLQGVYDLVCVGVPTEKFSASDSMRVFLEKLKEVDLSGKYAFVFDTKVSPGIFGSAAKYIEKELKNLRFVVLFPCKSATVSTTREGGAISGATLKEGEEKEVWRK